MRVLVLNERDLSHPLAGGVEVHLEEVASRLASSQGIEATVLCAGFAGGAMEETRRGVRYVRLGRSRVAYYARLPRRARAEVRARHYDLVVEDLCKLAFLSPLYLRNLPGMAIAHHLFGTSALRQVALPIAAAVLASEAFLPLLYRRWPVVAVSPSTRDDLVRRGLRRERIRVIPNGLDHERYRPDAATDVERDLVVFVGRLEHYKGVDVLLDAWPAVRAARPAARLAILGSGTALQRLRDRAKAGGAAADVSFCGFVDEAEKIDWLRRASVVVQPSRKEGWGLTVLEANACGTPVVASDVPGLRDSVRHDETGLLVRATDPRALADALVAVLADPALRERLASGGRAWASRFDWDQAAAAIAEVMRAAVAGGDLPESPDLLASRRGAAAAESGRRTPDADVALFEGGEVGRPPRRSAGAAG